MGFGQALVVVLALVLNTKTRTEKGKIEKKMKKKKSKNSNNTSAIISVREKRRVYLDQGVTVACDMGLLCTSASAGVPCQSKRTKSDSRDDLLAWVEKPAGVVAFWGAAPTDKNEWHDNDLNKLCKYSRRKREDA